MWNPNFIITVIQKRKNLLIIEKEKKACLSLMNRFNSLKHMQHFSCTELWKKRKKKRKKSIQSKTIQNTCNTAEHFGKFVSKT